MYNENMKIYGQSESGDILCLGIRLEDGNIGDMPMRGSRIDCQALVGERVVFYNKNRDNYCDIKVLKYIYEKNKNKRFIVKYQNEEKKEISCGNFIKGCNIGNVINKKLNTFRKVENYYIMTVETKGTKAEEDFNKQSVEIMFDGDEKTIENIVNSNWLLNKKGSSTTTYYIETGSYNQTGESMYLHKAVFNQFVPKGMVINHIKRAENGWKDNRLSNLELVTKKENSRNLSNTGYPRRNGKGWFYSISIDGFRICTPTKRNYDEVDLDSLIIQEYFRFTHRQGEWYKTKDVSQKYKDSLIELMKQKLEKKKNKGISFTKNKFEVIEIDEIKVVKVFDSKGRFCLIDRNDLWILDLGRLVQVARGYWHIRVNNKQINLHRYMLGLTETDKFHNIQVDHINQKPYDNRKENLRITTAEGNSANKDGVGYSYCDSRSSYRVYYKSYHFFLGQHSQISNTATPRFKTELEAQEEVYKRKYLANYIMPQFKNLDEYLIFEEEYNLNKKDGQTLDEYWITTRFPNINEIEIPKFSEENVDKL